MNLAPVRCFAVLLVLSAGAARADSGMRERLLMDPGWSFHLGDDWGAGQSLAKAGTGMGPASVAYSVASWRKVDLPHDWAIEMPFDPTADGAHGFRAIGRGFPQNSVAWYRRSFALPAQDAGKRLWLEFDGVYRDCTVFVNGWFAGRHESGYSSFRYDITDLAACGGTNVVAVRVDASQPEGWFYEGAGIYRHVWLVKTAPLAIAPDGIFVYSQFRDNIPAGADTLHLQSRLLNAGEAPADASVTWEISEPGGRTFTTTARSAHLAPRQSADLDQTVEIRDPQLWSPESPRLYTLVTLVASGGRIVDRVETPFGIRTFAFDANRGFILNGRPYPLKGTSNHQDHAGVGSALPDGLQYFRIARLKEMGCNAYRTAHNPPTPELLEACDRLGMLVMDENRQLGSDREHLERWEGQVRRDRNHASVAIWSLGNEEQAVQATTAGARVAATMQALVRRLDPSRPVTINADLGDQYAGVDSVIEVRGWSYHVGPAMDAYHAEHPLQPNVGSEQGSTVSTRGIYANDPVRGYVSAYDDNAPDWAQLAETWVTFFSTRPWLSGGFVWTGFDYRGEPTPYGWPCINSHFGIMDTCGFPKDNYWYYQARWVDRPVLHLLPHWNWPGREDQPIDVRAETNCDEVELSLNGRIVGRQSIKPASEGKWRVPYAPGVLAARGFRDGKEVAETEVETAGAPALLHLVPDRTTLRANGEDVSVITVAVADAQNRIVPTAAQTVSFELEGPGRILGVGNGDPSCHEPDTFFPVAESRSIPVQGWRWTAVSGPLPSGPPEGAGSIDESGSVAFDASAPEGPLVHGARGIFRAHVSVGADDLVAPVIELWIGRLTGGVGVYVNGQPLGGGVERIAPSVFDVKALLHPGDNTVMVTAANWSEVPSGISRGVTLRLQETPRPARWSRSVFNGYAQIILQASRQPGALRLNARADGLEPASLVVQSAPPTVPSKEAP
jgi:beta-galactosidase